MPFWSWLTRRPTELDEDDFKEEVRAHLAIDVEEKVADGLELPGVGVRIDGRPTADGAPLLYQRRRAELRAVARLE